jgi:lysyl-tRNA synthetase class 2
VISVDRQTRRFVLADESGSLVVAGDRLPAAGDLAEVVVRVEDRVARADHWCRLGGAPEGFLEPGSETHRLQQRQGLRIRRLRQRARALEAIRAFFARRGYLEVQTPARVPSPGFEPHLRAMPSGDRFLITSPEYQMKRLLAGGLERIYSLGPCWRGDERGPLHLDEFTMLEWYRAYSDLQRLMRETESLVRAVCRALHGAAWVDLGGEPFDLTAPFERLSVRRAFADHAGIDLTGVVSAEVLRQRAEAAGLGPFAAELGFDALFSEILVNRVEPALVARPAVFLYDYPAPLAALSRLRPDDPTIAERFELYVAGVELANAFGELTDAAEQRARLESDQRARAAMGAPVYPIDERFLAALAEGVPPTAGIALGFDRLLMVLVGATSLDELVAFTPEEL